MKITTGTMQADRWLKIALRIGGLFTLFIGIAHIFMPDLGYEPSVPLSMAPVIRDHFYYLATYAICGFLLTLGIISIYASKIKYIRVSLFICIVLSVLWIGRTILEIKYPVHVKLFFLDIPTVALLPVIMFIALTYSVGSLTYLARMNRIHPPKATIHSK
jgi:hypothetical protein